MTKLLQQSDQESRCVGGRPRTGSPEWRFNAKANRAQWMARVTLKNGERSPWIALDPKISQDDKEAAQAATRIIAQWKEQMRVELPLTGDTTVTEYTRRWFDHREASGKTSVHSDRARFRTHIEPTLGARRMKSIKKQDLEDLRDRLDEKKNAGELAPKTTLNIWGLVTKIFDDAHRGKPRTFQVREDNPARDVRGPDRGARPAKQFLYPTELAQLLGCTEVPVEWRELYALAAYTYLRAGELRALVWDDIDLERRLIHVTKAVDRSTQVIKPTKTGHTRQAPIEAALVPLLEKMRARGVTGQDPVVWMPDHRKQATSFRDHLKVAKITRHALLHSEGRRSMHVTFHDLRAGGITYCAVRNDPPVQIQRRAGHERFETTLLYIRIAESVDPASFGQPFPPLPASLVEAVETPAEVSPPGQNAWALTVRDDERMKVRSPARSPSEVLPWEWEVLPCTPVLLAVSQRREGDSNPWNPCELT
jgi:integrase